jgi:putative FmdB family regulatory protein
MPTYDYQCTRCSHRFEKFQQMSDKPLTKCPKCGAKVRRLIGAGAAVIMRGAAPSAPACQLAGQCPAAGSLCDGAGCHNH